MRTFALLALLAALAAPPAAMAQEPLTVYSSLPHVGATRGESDDIVRAARMALAEAGGVAGGHPVTLVALNDGSEKRGAWSPRRTAANARTAAGDGSAIAYLGELNSGATTFSMPITNEAGMLQVSPSNAYVGLTRSDPPSTEPGDPDRLIPTGRRTYGRVALADDRQADALARYAADLGIHRVVLVDDAEIYGAGLQHLLRARLRGRGIAVARETTMDDPRGLARSLRRVRAGALVYTGIAGHGAARLWRAVHRLHPRWKLLGADGIAVPAFARRLSPRAARRTRFTALPLAPSAYPPAGQAFFDRFRAAYGAEPAPYAIFGYEAMAVILDSIARAAVPTSRQAVVDAFFSTSGRESVLGRYSIDPFGDSTLGTFGGYRVDARGRIVWDRVIDIAG
jgi:branched-chain amino acid transport system substrate-binding protein